MIIETGSGKLHMISILLSYNARDMHTCAGVGLLCGHFRDFAPLASEVLFFVAECALLKEARRAV